MTHNDLDRVLVLDVETTGLDPLSDGLASIGAVWLMDLTKTFYIECHIDKYRGIHDRALEVNGFTRDQILDPTKPTEQAAVQAFIDWANITCRHPIKDVIIGGEQPFFDRMFCQLRMTADGITDNLEIYKTSTNWATWPFNHRMLDLHSVSFERFHVSLNHVQTCQSLLLEPEDKPHHALKGALSEARCFRKFFGIDPINNHDGAKDL